MLIIYVNFAFWIIKKLLDLAHEKLGEISIYREETRWAL